MNETTNILNQITKQNVHGKIESLSEEERQILLEALTTGNPEKEIENKEVELICPYPENTGCAEVRKTLSLEEKKKMEKNIKINPKGGIDIVPMNIKNMKLLTAQHNGKDIFDGSYEDKNGDTGTKGVTYLTGNAAFLIIKNQGKKLLRDRSEVEQCINYFPGKKTKKKIFNFVKIFKLEKAGRLCQYYEKWDHVGSIGTVLLSRIYDDFNGPEWFDDVCGLDWFDDNARIDRFDQGSPSPFLVFDDC